MAVNRKRKMINVEQESADFSGYTLAQIRDRVKYLIKQYGEDATTEEHVEPYSNSDCKYLYVYKEVPETDEQMAERIKSEERQEQWQADREMAEFRRLQEKFGK